VPPPQEATIAGLPSLCLFHRVTNLPCPGCGMTRSLVSCAHGLWAQAVTYHPLGPLLFIALVGLSIASVLTILRPDLRLAPSLRVTNRVCWMGLISLAAIWGARLAGMLPSPP
jgi:hypothetical protein